MDERTEKSFNRLKKAVLDDVQKKANELENTIDNEIEKVLSQKKEEFTVSAEKRIASETAKAKSTAKAKTLECDLNVKRGLIAYREELINSLFENVTDKLNAFKKTDAYIDWMKEKIRAAEEACGENCVFAVCAEDADAVKALGISAQTCGISGGIKAENRERGIVADFSFDILLEEARSDFLKTGGLTIEI